MRGFKKAAHFSSSTLFASSSKTSFASLADSFCSLESFDDASFDSHHHNVSRISPGAPAFEVISGLGKGGYGTVVLVKHSARPRSTEASNDYVFAMKVVSKYKQRRTKDQKRLSTELKVMRDMPPSRFVERRHAAFESASDVFFVCDYIGGGDLFYHIFSRMRREGGFREQEVKVLLAEVTLGLEHLHAHGFIHRDLKVENVMLDASGHVKIIDFGLASQITAHGAGAVQGLTLSGSLIYMAPELLKHRTGGRHTDWWAMGILAYELVPGRTPWSSLDNNSVIKHEITTCRVLPPTSVSAPAAEFVESLLHHYFRGRLGFIHDSDVKSASFFADVDWSAVERGENDPAFVCGPAKASEEESASPVEAYCSPPHSKDLLDEGSRIGKYGVRSPWFLGVDVVTSRPELVG